MTGIVDHTIRTLIHGLLLQARPLNLDVLQLLIVLTAFFPIVLLGMMRRPNLTLAASISVYFTARHLDWNLTSFPDGHWYFNPFCWQLLFVLGAWLASLDAKQMGAIRALQDFPILRVAAWLYLIFALVVTVAGRLPRIAGLLPDFLLDALLPNDKENLAPYRILHFLALAFLFSYAVPRNWRGFRWHALRPVIKSGEEWLAVFCVGVFLSFAAHLVLITGPDSLAMHVLVSMAGISIMTGVAYYVSWSKQQDRKPTPRTQSMTALPEEGCSRSNSRLTPLLSEGQHHFEASGRGGV